jgi:hypothetical protein
MLGLTLQKKFCLVSRSIYHDDFPLILVVNPVRPWMPSSAASVEDGAQGPKGSDQSTGNRHDKSLSWGTNYFYDIYTLRRDLLVEFAGANFVQEVNSHICYFAILSLPRRYPHKVSTARPVPWDPFRVFLAAI